MKTYEIAVTGKQVAYVVSAGSLADAQAQVCERASVQVSALGWWRVIPTARQIARPKSLMRGL